MKKKINLAFLSVLILFSWLCPGTIVNAASNIQVTESILTFSQLGRRDMIMRGPFDSASIDFSLPADWELQDGTELQLLISASFTGEPGTKSIQVNDYIGAELDIYFNGAYQQSIPLKYGENIAYQVPISAKDLVSRSNDGLYSIYFELNASIDCDFSPRSTTIVISSSSSISLPYIQGLLNLDLRRLPWPIYQPGKQLPNSTLVVLPNSPSPDEMQAALLTMAAFGRMTNSELSMSVISLSGLNNTFRDQAHLIFVGKPSDISLLSEIELPLAIQGARYSSPEMQEDDGLIQITNSKWNKSKTILVISGNTDAGVVKAAQALTTSNILTSNTNRYSIISKVNPNPSVDIRSDVTENPIADSDYLFSSLGYLPQSSSGAGIHNFIYEFNIPPGQTSIDKPYVDILFSISKLADMTRSGMTISLNGNRIGGAKFSTDEPDPSTVRANLPSSFLRTGRNIISIDVALVPLNICSSISFNDGLWVTIHPESILHLPLILASVTTGNAVDIKSYPYPFLNDPTLTSTTFILPPSDPSAGFAAGKIAYDLGSRSTGSIISFEVDFDKNLSVETKNTQNLIIIGIPNTLETLNELQDSMPAYFEPNSNSAILESQQVIYRISPNKSLGYLELFSLPWDSQYTALQVLGTNPEGLILAGDALIQESIRNTLRGNFAIVDVKQALVVDTRTGVGLGRVASDNAPGDVQQIIPEDLQTPTPVISNTSAGIRNLSLVSLIIVVVLMLLVILIAVRQSSKKTEN